jgi:hypothetical protein
LLQGRVIQTRSISMLGTGLCPGPGHAGRRRVAVHAGGGGGAVRGRSEKMLVAKPAANISNCSAA